MAVTAEFVSVVLDNITTKSIFYRNIRLPDDASIVFIECGRNATDKPPANHRHFTCNTPAELLGLMTETLEGTLKEARDCVINTVLIDNLSAFYWEQKMLPRAEFYAWYRRVKELLEAIVAKYQCNVVLTMWDKNYERGFNARAVDSHEAPVPKKLDDVTFTPADVFTGSVFALRGGQQLRFAEGAWHRQ